MADDRMKNNDLQRNMGTGDRDDQKWDQGQGQKTPGRNPQGDKSGQPGQPGQQGGGQQGQREPRKQEDDEFGSGSAGQGGSMNRGGQNR